jgi:sugar fermentation stimulation protein A
MEFPPLTEARLIRRYKRFLADVQMADGKTETVVVPNTGSLLGCADAETPVWLRENPPHTKYRYCMTLVKPGRCLVCVDTGIPNRVVFDAARGQLIPQLAGYHEYRTEVPLGTSSRADLCCSVHKRNMLGRCWVEVKATTLARGRRALFPDAVTARGHRHLRELQERVRRGDRSVQLFFVQRGDCEVFSPADDIDGAYGSELRAAAKAGVEIVALQADVTKRGVGIKRQIPVEL